MRYHIEVLDPFARTAQTVLVLEAGGTTRRIRLPIAGPYTSIVGANEPEDWARLEAGPSEASYILTTSFYLEEGRFLVDLAQESAWTLELEKGGQSMRQNYVSGFCRLSLAMMAALLALPAMAQSTEAEPTREEAMVAKAREMWETYYRLEHSFDPAIADLYSDTALIRNTRRYPDGNVRVMEIDVQKYRALIVAGMPLAKQLSDTNVYTEFRYTIEGENVRIDSQRYSERKKYTSPMSVLVGPTESGEWKILEEISESQP